MSIQAAYDEHDATGLAALVAKGEVSAEELLDEALRRADAAQERYNCITLPQPETARRLIADGLPDGPLRGVPFILKDLGAGAVDFPSNSGSKATANVAATFDSNFYARLRDAGLVTFARAPSPEFGVGPATEAAVYGGPTRNPWNPDHTPGGSSGGSAACVASGVVPAAHASDGAGSIRIPASSAGLYGLKPSRGLMPTGPVAGDGWGGLATNGFLSRTVRDTAALMDATAGADLGAPHAAPIPSSGFVEALSRPPEALRIGFLRTNLMGEPLHADVVAAIEDAAKLLESLGHHVEEAPLPDADTPEVIRAVALLMACDNAGTFRDLAKAKGVEPEELDIEPIAKGALRVGAELDGASALAGIDLVHRYGRRIAAWMQPYDAMLTATLAEPPAKIGRFAHKHDDFWRYRLHETEGVYAYSPFTASFNATGQPAASLPLFWNDEGLPIGVHIAMQFGMDAELIALSAQIEAARPFADKRAPGWVGGA